MISAEEDRSVPVDNSVITIYIKGESEHYSMETVKYKG